MLCGYVVLLLFAIGYQRHDHSLCDDKIVARIFGALRIYPRKEVAASLCEEKADEADKSCTMG